MTQLAVGVFSAVLLALLWGAGRAAVAVSDALASATAVLADLVGVVESFREGPEARFSERLGELEHTVDLLPQRWEEFKNAARRSEDRARAIVRDAQKQLEELGLEHAGIEAQATELRVSDGGRGGVEELPAVREDLESHAAPVEDWRAALNRKKYGA